MRILVLSMKYLPASGGSASYAYNLALGLHNEGHSVRVLAPVYDRKTTDEISPFIVTRMRGTTEGNPLRLFMGLLYVIHAYWLFKPDVIWTSSFAGCRVLGMLTFLRCPMVGTIHGGGIHRRYPSPDLFNKIGDSLGLRFMKRADALVTVSEESKKLFHKIGRNDILDKVHIVYSSIPIDESRYLSKSQALEKLPQFKNCQVLLTVSRLIRAKGHDLVIEALQRVRNQFPDLRYVIVGEGPEKESLMQVVEQCGLSKIVHFAGYVTDAELDAYFGVCDVFVMAGRKTPDFVEGFGLVFTEAGIRGRAVIGARIGGIPEAIAENETGLLMEPENIEDLAQHIVTLLKNEALRNRMAEYAVRFNKERFANEVMGRNNSNLLQTIIEKKPIRR